MVRVTAQNDYVNKKTGLIASNTPVKGRARKGEAVPIGLVQGWAQWWETKLRKIKRKTLNFLVTA